MGEEGKFKNLVIGGIVISLFSFLLLYFAINLGGNYDINTNDLSGSTFNYSGLNQTVQGIDETANDWKDIFTRNPLSVITGFLAVKEIFDLFGVMFKVVFSPISIFVAIMQGVLGIPPVVTGVLIFIITIIFIFAVWRLLKQGD